MIKTRKKDKELVQEYGLQRRDKNREDEREKKPMVFNKRQNPLSFVVDWQLAD